MLTTLQEVASHFRVVDQVVIELSAVAEIEMSAIGTRILQSATAYAKVMDVVHGNQPLVFTLGALFGASIRRRLVITVVVATVGDLDIKDSDVSCRVLRVRGKDADAVAGQVACTQITDQHVLALAYQMNAADIDAFCPAIIATKNGPAKDLKIFDILAQEELTVGGDRVTKAKGSAVQPKC